MSQPYQNLMDCLRHWKYVISDEHFFPQDQAYKDIHFSPQTLVGLMIHSFLSSRPRANFYTDGIKIYYERDQPISPLSSRFHGDVIRDQEIARILWYPSVSSYDELIARYGMHDGHLRLNSFEEAFQSERPNEDKHFLEDGAFQKLVEHEEKRHIRARVRKNLPTLIELIETLKKDEPPLPEYAVRLTQSLSEYEPAVQSYSRNRSRIPAA